MDCILMSIYFILAFALRYTEIIYDFNHYTVYKWSKIIYFCNLSWLKIPFTSLCSSVQCPIFSCKRSDDQWPVTVTRQTRNTAPLSSSRHPVIQWWSQRCCSCSSSTLTRLTPSTSSRWLILRYSGYNFNWRKIDSTSIRKNFN